MRADTKPKARRNARPKGTGFHKQTKSAGKLTEKYRPYRNFSQAIRVLN